MPTRPDLELVELRDAVHSAERAVAHWRQRLDRKVAEARDLGGFLSWLVDSITGGRRQRVEAAFAEVEAAKVRLDQAVRSHEEARAALARAEQGRLTREAEVQAAHARREALADQVRVSAHPLAESFNALESRLDALQLEHDTMRQAFLLGSALSASLESVQRTIDDARATSSRDRPRTPTFDDGRMRRLETQAKAFEDACAAIGLSIRVHIETPVRDQLGEIVRKWGHSIVSGMMGAAEADQFARSAQGALDATRSALGPLERQLHRMASELDQLKARREAILDRFE